MRFSPHKTLQIDLDGIVYVQYYKVQHFSVLILSVVNRWHLTVLVQKSTSFQIICVYYLLKFDCIIIRKTLFFLFIAIYHNFCIKFSVYTEFREIDFFSCNI